MAVTRLGLSAVGWKLMINSWWDLVLAGFVLASIVLGVSYLLVVLCRFIMQRYKTKSREPFLPRSVSRYFTHLRRNPNRLQTVSSVPSTTKDELGSFGVFLGAFDNPPTAAQQQLLSGRDVLVVDPFQDGVADALSTCRSAAKHVVGRVDMDALVRTELGDKVKDVTKVLATITRTLDSLVCSHEQSRSLCYSGVLLAGFRQHLQPAVVNELAKHIHGRGLDLWLELSFPEYLSEQEARTIQMKYVRGVVYRNGTIRPDGDRQNYFQMEAMRNVMREVAKQRVACGPALVMWETINDEETMQFAVVTRSYNLCTYNSAMCWIGHTAALFDAEAARDCSVKMRPLGALMWLKNEANMNAHDMWRANDKASDVDGLDLKRLPEYNLHPHLSHK